MAEIDVSTNETEGGWNATVTISEGASQTTHQVTLTRVDYDRLSHGASPQDLLRASFEFLLEREPKESILPRFDLPAISRYFPEYDDEIPKRLG